MSMSVEIRVNGDLIRRLEIVNLTEQPTGTNTYRWHYTAHDCDVIHGILSAKDGTVEHVMEDGSMALISKCAQAASETEVAAP